MTIPKFITEADPDIYYGGNYLVLDFEIDTSYGDYGHPVHPENQMLLACWEYQRQKKHVWGGEYAMQDLLADIEEATFVVAHNAKYELGWLKRCGADISRICVFDTQLAEYVLSGNLKSASNFLLSLNACCVRRGWKAKDPVVDHLIKDGVNPVSIPRSWLHGRCARDVSDTHRLFKDQLRELAGRKQLAVLYTRCLLPPVLADIESNGMKLDEQRVMEAHSVATSDLIKADNALQDMANINWDSPIQLAEFLYDTLGFEELTDRQGKCIRTDTQKRKTDIKTLQGLKATTPEQKQFLEVYQMRNTADAALTKSLNFFKAVCEKKEGVMYAEFNQTVTATHRLSSSGMEVDGMRAQFQNLPSKYKNLFRARKKGWKFCEWDGSGLEFRGAGLISGDANIRADINNPEFDPHRRSASIINKVPEDKVTKEQRKRAKAHTFKPLFGGQSGTKAEQTYYKAFNERYSGLVNEQNLWLSEVINTKQLRTKWGLTFFFPYAKMDSSGYVNVKTNVFNYPIQAVSTAEIIPLALVAFWHRIKAAGKDKEIVLVNTVHDSVLCEVAEGAEQVYIEAATEAWKYVYWYFENVYEFPLKGLPLGTEVTMGEYWTEGESKAYNIHQNGVIEELK